jgi:hypothetical protein
MVIGMNLGILWFFIDLIDHLSYRIPFSIIKPQDHWFTVIMVGIISYSYLTCVLCPKWYKTCFIKNEPLEHRVISSIFGTRRVTRPGIHGMIPLLETPGIIHSEKNPTAIGSTSRKGGFKELTVDAKQRVQVEVTYDALAHVDPAHILERDKFGSLEDAVKVLEAHMVQAISRYIARMGFEDILTLLTDENRKKELVDEVLDGSKTSCVELETGLDVRLFNISKIRLTGWLARLYEFEQSLDLISKWLEKSMPGFSSLSSETKERILTKIMALLEMSNDSGKGSSLAAELVSYKMIGT